MFFEISINIICVDIMILHNFTKIKLKFRIGSYQIYGGKQW